MRSRRSFEEIDEDHDHDSEVGFKVKIIPYWL